MVVDKLFDASIDGSLSCRDTVVAELDQGRLFVFSSRVLRSFLVLFDIEHDDSLAS